MFVGVFCMFFEQCFMWVLFRDGKILCGSFSCNLELLLFLIIIFLQCSPFP